MRADAARFIPFMENFQFAVHMCLPIGRSANWAEIRMIARMQASGPRGYNTLKGPPPTDARYHAMQHTRRLRGWS
jgi:hypothetical protein